MRGIQAMVTWLVLEVVVRRVGAWAALLTFEGLARSPDPELPPTAVVVATLALAMVILMLVFGRTARREGLTPADLGYRWSSRTVGAGIACGVVLFIVILGTAAVDHALFDPGDDAGWSQRLARASPALIVALVLTNGLLTPAVEEYAWRGYIQRQFVRHCGVGGGVAATAAGFAIKHVLVDLSLTRTVTLVVGACALGVIASRWGTAASTLAHAVINTAAMALVIVHARAP